MTAALTSILKQAFRPEPSRPAPPWGPADEAIGNAWTIQDPAHERCFFFITGCSKSGTHWIQNLLNLHPLVCVKGEFHFEHLSAGYHGLIDRAHYTGAKPHVRPCTDASYHGMVRRMMYVAAREKPDAIWIGDRSPRTLCEILPGAPIINIRRDGRDVLVSWNFHHMRAANIDYLPPVAQPGVRRFGPQYRASPEQFARPGTGLLSDEAWFRAQAAIWARNVDQELTEVPRLRERGTPILQVLYESLHRNLASARHDLFEFLLLDDSHAAPVSRESRTAPGFEGAGHLDFFRKGAVGEWREFFTPRQKQWFKEVAGQTLIRAGYEKDMNW